MIANAHKAFDKEGKLIDEMSRDLIKKLLEELVNWTKRLGGS
jgi:hypothetical protein